MHQTGGLQSFDVKVQLDAIRVSASKSSPMMEAINLCVRYIDKEVLDEIIPRLCELLKAGLGLGTRVGCSNFVVSLTLQCRNEVLPYSGKILAALLNGLSDHNSTVRRSYANAIGHLVKYSKETSVQKLISKVKGWYTEKEDKARQLSCAWTFQAITRHSPDTFKDHAAAALPVVFLAMHEEKIKESDAVESMNNSQEIWEEVWQNTTPGTQAGIKLYFKEILEAVNPVLSSQSWTLKAQAAKSIITIANTLGASLSQPYLGNLTSILAKALPGRIWTGKEQILKSVSTICSKCRKQIEMSYTTEAPCPEIDHVVDALFKECRKESIDYKIVAITSTAEVVDSFDMDRFSQMKDIVDRYVRKKENDDNDDSDDDVKAALRSGQLKEVCIDALGKCWPTDVSAQENHVPYLTELLTKSLNSNVWRVQLSLLKTGETFVRRLHWELAKSDWKNTEGSPLAQDFTDQFLPELCSCLDGVQSPNGPRTKESKDQLKNLVLKLTSRLKKKNKLLVVESTTHASVRIGCLKFVRTFIRRLKEYSGIDFCLEKHKDKLKSLVRTFSSSDNYEVAEIASQVQKLVETYN